MSREYQPGPPHYETGDPFTDGYVLTTLGKTQTGKTSFGRELHAESPRFSVWLNATGKDRVDDVPGTTVRSVEGVAEAMRQNEWAVEFVSDDRRRDVVALQDLLWSVAENTNRQFPMQVVFDEVQEIAPQSNKAEFPPRDAVRRLAKRGVKRGIKTVPITQDPTEFDKQTLRQSEYRVFFPMTRESRQASVISKMGIDWDAVESGDRYTGALFDDTGRLLSDSVKAEARYA